MCYTVNLKYKLLIIMNVRCVGFYAYVYGYEMSDLINVKCKDYNLHYSTAVVGNILLYVNCLDGFEIKSALVNEKR